MSDPAVSKTPYLDLLVAVLRGRRLVVLTGMLLAVIVVVAGLLKPRSYTSESSFFPQSRKLPTSFSGIAAQLGVALPGTDLTEGPAFFETLLRTKQVLDSTLLASYSFTSDSGPVTTTLLGLLRLNGDSAVRLARGRVRLLELVSSYVDYKVGIVRLKVTTGNPTLSALVSRRMLDLLDRFNRETRQSQASAERSFTERRMGEVRDELRGAEDRLQDFLTRNREYNSSAQLRFMQERLAREVSIRQQVYTTLSQAYEQARIEEVRDTPVLTVVQEPRPAELPDGRGLLIKAIVAAFLGAILAAVIVIVRENMSSFERQYPSRHDELAALRAESLADLRRPWRLLGVRR